MAATLAPALAGLKISHGDGWGHVRVSDDTYAYVDRNRTGPGDVSLLIEDGPNTIHLVILSEDAFRALRAAIIAARCPHHGELVTL